MSEQKKRSLRKTVSRIDLGVLQGETKNVVELSKQFLRDENVLAALEVIDSRMFFNLADADERADMLEEAKVPIPPQNLIGLANALYALLVYAGYTAAPTIIPSAVEVKVDGEFGAAAATGPLGGEYAFLLGGQEDVPISSAALHPDLLPEFIDAAGNNVYAAVCVGTGILSSFDGEFWKRMALTNMQLRGQISTWQHNYASGNYVTEAALQEVLTGVNTLFGSNFDQMIQVVAEASAHHQALDFYAGSGHVDVGKNAVMLQRLASMIPYMAEEVGTKMVHSDHPEKGQRVVVLVNDLLMILKNPILHQHAGIVNPASPDKGAIEFLKRNVSLDMANRFRLALAYRNLIRALKVCPPNPLGKPDYLIVMGMLANELYTQFNLVAPTGEVVGNVSPFRAHGASVGAATGTSFSVRFGINLKFSFNRS